MCTNYVCNQITMNKKNNLRTGIIFVDLANAYNTVKSSILIKKIDRSEYA